jgi:hypothetical protein
MKISYMEYAGKTLQVITTQYAVKADMKPSTKKNVQSLASENLEKEEMQFNVDVQPKRMKAKEADAKI